MDANLSAYLTKIAEKHGKTLDRFLVEIAYGEFVVTPTQCGRAGLYFREQLSELIEERRTFVLFYLDSELKERRWSVRYAEINIREECAYLDAWCEETQELDGTELDAIAHNVCFRFDKIARYEIDDEQWREEGLDTIPVRVAFYGKTAIERVERATGAKDIAIQISASDRGIIETVEIASVFWFLRSIIDYGDAAEIIEPKPLRAKMKENLKKILARY